MVDKTMLTSHVRSFSNPELGTKNSRKKEERNERRKTVEREEGK